MASVQHDPLLEEEVMHNHLASDVSDLTATLDPRYVNTIGDTMTGTLNFSSAGITNAESVTYDITQTRTPVEGETIWNDDAKTLEVGLKGGFPLEIGLQQVELCVNKTGSSISKGKVVYINGGQGNRPTITLADNSTDATSARTFGVTVEAINDNNSGYVVSSGIVIGLNTNAYTAGTQLYLSTSGDMTSTKPVAPAHMVYVAKVLTQSTTVGAIHVGVMNGLEIDELHDVLITSPANKDTIAYDSTSSLWKNKSLATLKTDLDLTGTNSGDVTVTDSSTIDFTLTGQALTGSVIQSGIDHGSISGLSDDDHTQYALLAGRSGGQTLSGGTAANDDLTLQGTTNATRTTSYVLLQPNGGNVGIGTASPEAKLQIFSSTISDALMLSGSSLSNNARKYSGIIGKHYTNTEEPSGIIWYDSNVSSSEVNFGGGTSILNAPTDITFWAAANTTTTTGTEYLHIYGNGAKVIFPNGNVGIGTTSPKNLLSLGGTTVLVIGTDSSDGTDNRLLRLSSAGGSGASRGAYLDFTGNEHASAGGMSFVGGTGAGDIIFYTGASTTEKLRLTGAGNSYFSNGNVGINETAPSAQLHVDQTSTTAAKPTLRLQQADLSEEFIRFDATVGTGNPINTTALGTYYGRVRVYVEGVGEKWLALYNT